MLRFIENNWRTGRIGDASFDSRAGSLNGLFDWFHPQQREVLLSPGHRRGDVDRLDEAALAAPAADGWLAQP